MLFVGRIFCIRRLAGTSFDMTNTFTSIYESDPTSLLKGTIGIAATLSIQIVSCQIESWIMIELNGARIIINITIVAFIPWCFCRLLNFLFITSFVNRIRNWQRSIKDTFIITIHVVGIDAFDVTFIPLIFLLASFTSFPHFLAWTRFAFLNLSRINWSFLILKITNNQKLIIHLATI